MTIIETYLSKCKEIIERIDKQQPEIAQAASWFAESILAGRVVHVFGSGHSRIMVEEMWPRYGSFPGFNPIVELSLTYHNNVVGANGQRQAMFLENVSGLAERILRNFATTPQDTALVISSGGCNIVPVEMAEQFQQRHLATRFLAVVLHPFHVSLHRPEGVAALDFRIRFLEVDQVTAADVAVKSPNQKLP